MQCAYACRWYDGVYCALQSTYGRMQVVEVGTLTLVCTPATNMLDTNNLTLQSLILSLDPPVYVPHLLGLGRTWV